MPIESPRIAGKPVAYREETPINCVSLLVPGASGVDLQTPFFAFNPDSKSYEVSNINNFTTTHGLLVFSSEGGKAPGRLYVAIQDPVSSQIDMVPVVSSVFFNANMAKVYDPLGGFYDPLAS